MLRSMCDNVSTVLLSSNRSVYPRVLHSFPTRRSSDLNGCVELNLFAGILGCGDLQGLWRRSEEHTSELQSRGHLVCRLLLEKKKVQTLMRDTAKQSLTNITSPNHTEADEDKNAEVITQ